MDDEARKEGKKIKAKEVASAWIDKKGYPIVKVQKDRKNAGFSLGQERFTTLGKSKGGIWPIPITYFSYLAGNGKEARILLEKKNGIIKDEADWIKLNYGQKGFYRVKYEKEMLEKLGKAYRDGILDDADGCGIESDLYNMLRARQIGLDDYLSFIKEYMMEPSYPLNMQIAGHIMGLNNITYSTEQNKKIKELGLLYFKKALDKLGLNPKKNEDEFSSMFRPSVITGLGILGDEKIAEFAKENIEKAIKGDIDPNIRNAIYFVSAWNGDKEVFEMLKNAYIKEEFPEKKVYLLLSLGFFKEEQLCKEALEFSLSKHVKLQDSFYVASEVASNPANKWILLDWVEKNWNELRSRFGAGNHILPRFVSVFSSYYGYEKLNEIKRFFTNKKNYTPMIKKDLDETLESIEINTLFMEHIRK